MVAHPPSKRKICSRAPSRIADPYHLEAFRYPSRVEEICKREEELSKHRNPLDKKTRDGTHKIAEDNQPLAEKINHPNRSANASKDGGEQYRSIFELIPDALFILTLNGTIVEANPAACRMHGYRHEELIGLSYDDILDRRCHRLLRDLKRQAKTGEFHAKAIGMRKDGSPVNIELYSAAFNHAGKPHLLLQVRDITEQLIAYQTLEQQVEERTRELSTLLEVSHNVTSTLEMEPLLGLILDQLKSVVDYTGASILRLEEECLTVSAHRGPIPPNEARRLRYTLENPLDQEVILRRKPVIIADLMSDTPIARAFKAPLVKQEVPIFNYIRSWIGVPLVVKERAIGMLTLDHSEPNYYSTRQAELVLAFANQVAAAIENARLYQAEEERLKEIQRRHRVAEGLRDILTVLNSNRPLEEILDYIVAEASRLLEADAGAIYRQRGKDGPLRVQAARGLDQEYVMNAEIPVGSKAVGLAVMKRAPVIISDTKAILTDKDGPRQASRRWELARLASQYRAVLSVPLIVQDEIYGGISVYYSGPRAFTSEETELAVAFSDQAALAIQNAQLRAQVEQAAAAAERQRLARDLHDAVTQTLFSCSLIAEVLPRLWERSPDEARKGLEELRRLTRGALAEMRALLVELRPAALTEIGLGDLLRQLTEAVTSRARVPITLRVEGRRPIPADVQIALYRITQEALNNVAKHARASQTHVTLCCRPGGVELRISDDGCGFDPSRVSPQCLGLGIMRERAMAAGATLEIESQLGQGTRVVIIWPDALERSTDGRGNAH